MSKRTGWTRRRLLLTSCTAVAGIALPARAQRADTLRIVCGYPPGGTIDIVARKLADKLTGRVPASAVVVENKPGAAGRLAVEEVKRAIPGSAMLITPASVMTMYPHVFRQLAYDPFKDVLPVSTVANSGFALAVGARVPASVGTLQELVRWCRAEPASATCGHAGAGSMPHLMTIVAARALNVELTPIPYRGGLAAAQGTAAGETAMTIATEGSARALQQAGKLRVVATTWDARSPFFPEAPTFREAGVDLVQREWFGAFAPAGTPEAQIRLLAEGIRGLMQQPDVRDLWERTSLTNEAGGPVALEQAMRSEHDYWGRIVRASGFTPES